MNLFECLEAIIVFGILGSGHPLFDVAHDVLVTVTVGVAFVIHRSSPASKHSS